jgi:hypothetical protein
MGKFIDQVRASKVSHPTQKNFSIESWKKAYNSYADHSEEDQRLFESGLWVFDKLNTIRNRLDDIFFGKIAKSELVRYLCGYLNRSAHIISQKQVPLVNEDTYISESLIQMKTPENVVHPHATPDELIIGAVDSIRYPLSFIESFFENSTTEIKSEYDVLTMITRTLMLGSIYDATETIWMDCLWLGKYINKMNEYELVIDSDINAAINRAVSDYRRQSLILQFTTQSMFEWQHSLSEETKRDIYRNAFEIKIERINKKKKLFFCPMQYRAEIPPDFLQFRLLAEESYFHQLRTVKLPKYQNFTLDQLLSAWEIMHGVASKLFSMFPMDSGVHKLNKLLQYAPTIEKDELAKLFSQSIQISHEEGKQLVNFFIFPGTPREEVWFYPLVEVDEKKVCPVISAVLHPNLLRSIDHWLARSGIDFASKGGELEKETIREFNEGLRTIENEKLKDIQISTISKKAFGEQIDLIIRLRNTFLIGEVKCTLYPTEPLEFYRYYEIIIKSDAVPQIRRKVDFISKNREKFLEVMGLSEKIMHSDIRLIPFIFTNHPYCVGFPIEGVPVVDRYILGRYIDAGEYDRYVLFEQNGTKTVGEKVIFYDTEKEAEDNLESYLLNPPQLELFKKFIRRRIFPIPALNEGDKNVAFVTLGVQLPIPSADKSDKDKNDV